MLAKMSATQNSTHTHNLYTIHTDFLVSPKSNGQFIRTNNQRGGAKEETCRPLVVDVHIYTGIVGATGTSSSTVCAHTTLLILSENRYATVFSIGPNHRETLNGQSDPPKLDLACINSTN